MCINKELFERVYKEGVAFIEASSNENILSKKERFDTAYQAILQEENPEIQEFYGTLNELRLFQKMCSLGYNVSPHDDSTQGPDFECELGYIECVSLTKGEKKEWVDKVLNGSHNRYYAAFPRMSSAIRDKKEKYLKYIKSGAVDKNMPRIIEVGTSLLRSDIRDDLLVVVAKQILYGIGYQLVPFNTRQEKADAESAELHSYVQNFPKNDQIALSGDIFHSSEYEDVSAILLVTNDLGSKLESQDMLLLLNPNAKVPVNESMIKGIRCFKQVEMTANSCTYKTIDSQ